MTGIKDEKISEACTILFGEDFSVDKATIDYLQISGIKHAFRERVKEFHPDTSVLPAPEAGSNFLKLKDAYDFLVSVKKGESSSEPVRSNDSYRGRTLPRRKLRLGEYLFYSGKIDWQELIAAITWQRQNMKKNKNLLFGLYFMKHGILSSAELGFAVFKLNIHNSNFSPRK